MSRVEQGIAINEQHIYNVEHNIEEQISFIDQMKEIGYINLEEFFTEKVEHDMQEVLYGKVYSVEPKDAMPTLRNLIQNHEFGIVSVYTNETCVHHGGDPVKVLNVAYCEQNNIPIYPYDSFGGSIVATEGDYSVALLLPLEVDASAAFVLSKTKAILDKYFDSVEIQGNDIMIDNKKVAGGTSFGTEDFFFFIYHFSMSEKAELIRAICGDPVSNKVPGCIDRTVLPTEQLMEEFLSWLQGL